MPIALYRIDERLLHGQVVVGWGRNLGLAFYVVVDDEIAGSEWEKSLYASALPEGVESFFFAVDEAIRELPRLQERRDLGMVLTAGTGTMRRLGEAGLLTTADVNLGGLHAAPGRRRLLDHLFLSPEELDDVRALVELAGTVSARELPGSPEVGARRLMRTFERARR